MQFIKIIISEGINVENKDRFPNSILTKKNIFWKSNLTFWSQNFFSGQKYLQNLNIF